MFSVGVKTCEVIESRRGFPDEWKGWDLSGFSIGRPVRGHGLGDNPETLLSRPAMVSVRDRDFDMRRARVHGLWLPRHAGARRRLEVAAASHCGRKFTLDYWKPGLTADTTVTYNEYDYYPLLRWPGKAQGRGGSPSVNRRY